MILVQYRVFFLKVIVRYVDFGNTETIRKDTLVELPPSLADARPFAQLFHLADCVVSTDPGANEMTYALVRCYSFFRSHSSFST